MRTLTVLILSLLSFSVLAADVQLTWGTPTEREDGTPLAAEEIGSYVIEYGQEETSLGQSVTVEGTLNTTDINGLPNGTTQYFRIATVDSDGLRGEFSDTINVDLPNAAPSAPSNFVVTVKVRISVEIEEP